MAMTFQSLRSSSNGNCLLLCSGSTSILIDCGFKTQKECRALLNEYAGNLHGVLVSHAHGDHICYSALKVLQQCGATVHCHEEVAPHIHRKHIGRLNSPMRIEPFATGAVSIGDFNILPIPLPHEPSCPTFGFAIRCGDKKLVVCTDFYDPDAVSDHLVDADFIFMESNHDLDLLKQFPNYASHYHLSNKKAAKLLCDAVKNSRRPPKSVMLGHLSEQRNHDDLAWGTVENQFRAKGLDLDFDLRIAPRRSASAAVTLD
jgi:phosphoribosyl 1,2-cyclic phosphodiesterase